MVEDSFSRIQFLSAVSGDATIHCRMISVPECVCFFFRLGAVSRLDAVPVLALTASPVLRGLACRGERRAGSGARTASSPGNLSSQPAATATRMLTVHSAVFPSRYDNIVIPNSMLLFGND